MFQDLTAAALVARGAFDEALRKPNGTLQFRKDKATIARITEARNKWNKYLKSPSKVADVLEHTGKNFIHSEYVTATKEIKICAVLCLLENTLKEACSKGKPTTQVFPC